MDAKFSEQLSAHLKELRSDLQLTQKEFAERINASPVSISSYEIGAKTPSLEMLIKIATTFNVSLSWLCGLSPRKSMNKVFNTYTDIIDMFFDIMNIAELDVYPTKATAVDSHGNKRTMWGISFTDDNLNIFLQDWTKMRNLYISKTIDEEVYALWREKTIAKYNIPIISEHDD